MIVATGLGTIATATGSLASKSLLTAETIGISVESLKAWETAARVARVDANGLISAMGALDTAMVEIGANGNMDGSLFTVFGQIQQELKKHS